MSDTLDFDLVLKQDLSNIIKKAAAGQPLTGRERDLIQTEKNRRAKVASEASSASAEKVRAKSGRAAATGFTEPYSYYANKYGASERTIKRWVWIGRESDDPIPLDEPLNMRAWWARRMRLRCPPGIMQAEVSAKKEGPGADVAEPVERKAAETKPVVPMDLGTDEVGLGGALKRLEKVEVLLAAKATDPGQAKPWLDTISRMTSVATKLRQELEAQGKLVPKVEVAAEIKSFHGQIVSVLKSVLPADGVREVFDLLNQKVFSE